MQCGRTSEAERHTWAGAGAWRAKSLGAKKTLIDPLLPSGEEGRGATSHSHPCWGGGEVLSLAKTTTTTTATDPGDEGDTFHFQKRSQQINKTSHLGGGLLWPLEPNGSKTIDFGQNRQKNSGAFGAVLSGVDVEIEISSQSPHPPGSDTP